MRTSNTSDTIERKHENKIMYSGESLSMIEDQIKELQRIVATVKQSVGGGNLDGNKGVPPALFKIITENNYKDDNRIPIALNKRKELMNDFWKLKNANILVEDDIALLIRASFKGFIKLEKELIIRPKIGIENIRYFIRSIYKKYGDENRKGIPKYRDILKRTHYYNEKSEYIMKHFADKMPKKYPKELVVED